MDSVIAVLPATVVDQIAAGEVIERPASVVKELIDNALDAGARTIAVETAGGGKRLVRVVDDGCGMSPADAVRALERHATSKIRGIDDLWDLPTMGFRGEALPSIASVGRMTITTRRAGDLAATRVVIEGGKLIGVDEVGAPVGTAVEVRDLLYNVPARLKFLRSEATEAAHVTELCTRVALAHPALHVRLRHDGRAALDTPPDRDGLSRVRALLGPRIAARMIEASGEEGGVRVAAFLGAPELAQTTARGVQLFVGRRWVRDRGLLHALCMGYGELVPRGRYPLAVVCIDVSGGAVDVNVHPQKLEVRFADPSAVAAAVRHVIQAAVARAAWRAEAGAGPVMMTAIAGVAPPALPDDGPATGLAMRYAAQLRDARAQGRLGLGEAREWVREVRERARGGGRRDAAGASGSATAAAAAAATAAVTVTDPGTDSDSDTDSASASASTPVAAPGFFGGLRYLGQLDLTYLVCEADGELVLVDQHVAHERVELARLIARGDREAATQRLLFPTTIEVAPELIAIAGRTGAVLARVGYEVEPFGATSLAVKSVPAGIRHGDPAVVLRGLLESWADGEAPSDAEQLQRVLATIACHSVVRAGDRLAPNEAQALLASLDGVELAGPGPHGRPLLLRLPVAEIARRFGR